MSPQTLYKCVFYDAHAHYNIIWIYKGLIIQVQYYDIIHRVLFTKFWPKMDYGRVIISMLHPANSRHWPSVGIALV